MINRALTLPAIVTLVLLTVLAALVAGASAVSAQGAVPDAPDRPVGTAVFIGGVDLEWNEVPGADSYGVQIYRNGQWTDLPGDGIEIAFYGAGAIISELEPEGSSYWFRVRARSVHGFSEWSDFNFMASTNESKSGRRARPDNVPASGTPVISGTAQVGETLTADTTGIGDGNGLDRVKFRFQWVSHDGSADTDIANATDSTYTLVADDAGKTIKVRVAFTDRGGYSESLTGGETATVAARPNSPATGAPSVTGTAEVGKTLTADTSGIADDDGLSGATFSYQWIANDGSADTDIQDATDSTYTLVADDEGKTVKVLVSFTDDAGTVETLTSTATNSVAARPNSAATGAPTINGTIQVGETLTADTSGIGDADGLNNVSYSYQWVANDGTADTDITDAADSTYTLVAADEDKTVKVQVSFTDDAGNEETLTSAATDAVASLPNSPATGVPTITGVVQVGETLTAETISIADADGLDNAVFSYQWLADDADISGATGKTYALTEADEGKTVKVQVSFTDDAGNEETLTSAATDAVASLPNNPATGVPTITGVVQVGETLTAETTGIADADGLDNAVFSYQWLADDADISGATGKTYALTEADEGKTVKVQVSFTDDAGNEETLTSAATDAVASLPNNPATGVPTITGVVQVGETLTAETTGIADADGLDNAVFSYQWLADDADISGATGKTYALTEADEGKTVKVQVSFTDDAGNEETLTSAATDAVASLPNSPATGAPTITLSFLTATPAHVSQLEVVGIHVTADHVYIAANGGGLSSVWMFGGSAMRPEQYLPLDFEPRGLAASSAHLYVLDASGTAHAYDLETLSPDSSSDIRFALRGTDNPAASLRGVYALAANDPGFTGPDSGMGLVYAARRIETGVDKWEVVGPPGVGVHHDELVQLGITDLDGSDVATDLSTYLFVENGTGDGAHVFEVQPSGSAELSHGPELYFGRTGHDGLYYDGSLLWTLDVDSYEWDPNDGQTLTLRAFDPAQRTILPDHFHELLHESDNIGSCDIENLDDVEDLDHVEDLNSLLLPDLVSCQHDYSVAEVVVAPDGTELHALRFAGFVTNLGYGPLDLKGNPQLADDADLTSHDVWQRALTVDGDWVNLTKPPIKFERVDGHGHFHLRGIVEYSLWDTSGTVEIRSGAKVGFCLLDVEERPDLHPNPGPERYMLWDPDIHFCKSGRPGAKNLRMGISEGWQDIYSFAAPFQWIDVSNVRPGYYRVGQRVDPDNVIVESDETNNGLALSQRLHVVPGYVARPETVRVEPDATVRFKLSADEYFDDTNFEDGSTRTRAHRIVTQPSHGSLDVGDTVTVIVDGATYQVFTDEWVTYTPDPGYAGADSFTFVALDESLPRYPINPVVATVTLDITDAPTIRGTAQVGETLTADTSGIGDTDSITGISYSYQWVRNDGTNDTDITGATDSTYTMVAADEGRTIKVGVSFTDDAGNEETLTSAATSSVTARPEQDIAPNAPDLPIGTAVFVGGVDLEWNEVPVADSYEVQLYQNGQWIDLPGDGVEIAFYGAGAIISGLDPSLTLWFQVRARNAHGSSDWSDFSSLSSTNQFTLGKRARSANEAARGAPVINGTAQVGEILTADTTGIEDGNGLDRVQFRFQWATNDGSADTDIAGATNSTYTLAGSDEGKTIKVRVAFTDRGGYAESLTSDATETVSFAGQQQIANNPATGGPIIGGTVRVGETLATDVLGIADEDGLENATFSYQWISNDGTTDADIQGETGATYTLTDANEGKTVKVRVSFTDDADNEETVTSAATATVAARPNRPATGAPIIGGTVRVGETLATDVLGIADEDGLENATFSYQWISNDGTTDADIQGETGATYTLTDANEGKTVKVRVSFTDDADNEETVTSAATATVAARPNRPATGAPIIGGTVRVGETLATDVLGIADEDGLENATFSYQWISNDGTTDADIQGETGATYTLTDANEGKTVKVRVSFTDDADNEETVTSAATATVAARPNRPATGAPIIGGTVRVGETLATDVLGIADEDGLENATFSYQWISNDGTTDADIQGETGATYTLTDANEGKTVKVRVSFTDDADNEETVTSAATATGSTSQQTGDRGTDHRRNRVGETLATDVLGIADEDGLENATFSYQWISNDGTTDADIQGETGATYTLASAYVGKTIKVKVTFTDDADNEETLTSPATAEVAAGVPTDPPAKPRNLTGTANADGTVTLRWDAPDDDSVTGYQILRRRPTEGERTLLVHVNDTGSTATEYTDNDVTPDVLHAYRVTTINAVGLSRRSEFVNVTPTQPAEPAQNAPATGTPTISGNAQVGETLTAGISEIADEDGLENAVFSYQWVASNGTTDTNIAAATDSTYDLVAADAGKTIKVRVSFTDDAGNEETLTSTATNTVTYQIERQISNSPATGAPSVTGTAQVGDTLTADTSSISDDDGLTNVSYQYQWLRNDGNSDSEIAGATDSTYALADDDEGNTVKVRVSFTDDAGTDESLTSPATATVAARISSPATGVPSVTGTAQVGRTLTADTSGIADDDGLTNVSYSYQWVRTEINDSEHVRPEGSDYGWVLRLISEDIEIAGATNSTYTLVAADGRYSPKNTIKVRVSFTDDKGNEETLTSTSIEVSEKAITISQPYEPPQNEDSPVEHAHIFPLVGSGYGPDGRTWELEFAVGPLVPDDDATTKDYIINYRIVDENGDPLPNCEGDGLGGSLHFMTVSDQVGGNQHSGEVGLSCRGAYFALIEVLDANSNFIDRIVINVS